MPRTRYPRISLPRKTTLPAGFGGGLAQGLLTAIPYIQQPMLRQQALEEQLTKMSEARLKQLGELQNRLLAERSDILQRHILVKPASSPQTRVDILSELVGRDVEPITLEEQRRFLETGEAPEGTMALPVGAVNLYVQQQRQEYMTTTKAADEFLKRINAARALLTSKAQTLRQQYQGGLLPTDELRFMGEMEKIINELENLYNYLIGVSGITTQPKQPPKTRRGTTD